MVVFDIGANQGDFLQLIATLQYKKIQVHAFEPSCKTFELLKNNTSTILNNFDSLKLNNIGLGKQIKTDILYYNSPGSGLASLTKRNLKHFKIDFNQSEEIYLTTLDDYCVHNCIENIDLLKIDVEGHELDVFHGANDMLKNARIKMIMFEFGGCNIDTRSFFQDYWYLLSDQYDLFRITPSGFLYPIKKYQEKLEQFRTTNFFAVLKQGIYNKLKN